jgi:protoheme IX farnesyltransferase
MTLASTTISDATFSASEPAQPGLVSSYMALTKARLSAMVLVTAAVGFVLAAAPGASWLTFVWTVLGTALAAGAAATFNQVLEMPRDALMVRTCRRPLVCGALSVRHACIAGSAMAFAGIGILLIGANVLAAVLAALTITLYVGVYTPMKTRSSLNTFVGAVVGAMPPMIGWAAATGSLSEGAFVLGAVLFVWQIPHFLALAWMYREDYARGGFIMLPVVDQNGELTCRVMVVTSLLMLPIALVAVLAGLAGWLFAAASLLLGLMLIVLAMRLYLQRTHPNARAVFLASIVYLPLLMGMLVADRGSIATPWPTSERVAMLTEVAQP